MGDIRPGTQRALGFFCGSKVGVSGLTVTVDYMMPNGTIVTGASASALGIDGAYYIDLPFVPGGWFIVFKTTSDSVDQKHVPGLIYVDPPGVHPYA